MLAADKMVWAPSHRAGFNVAGAFAFDHNCPELVRIGRYLDARALMRRRRTSSDTRANARRHSFRKKIRTY
jgi:hypothetical protein